MSLSERFWTKVVADENGCLIWQGARRSGYGAFWQGGRVHRAHRLAYEDERGSVPDAMVLDHLCGVRACVNPYHLEAVTQRTNLHRSGLYMATRDQGKHRGKPLEAPLKEKA